MKTIKFIGLLITLSITSSYAKVTIVPLDTEPGQWMTTSNTNQAQIIENMLKNYPKEQKEMMKKMITKMMPKKGGIDDMKQKQCITKDSYKEMEEKLKKSLGGNNADKCKLEVLKSTSKIFSAVLNCGAIKSEIETKVINSKKNISKVITNIPSMGKQEIVATSVWKSAKCN